MQIKGYGYENMKKASIKRTANTILFALTGGEFELSFFDGSSS
jgi:hypothetical protein